MTMMIIIISIIHMKEITLSLVLKWTDLVTPQAILCLFGRGPFTLSTFFINKNMAAIIQLFHSFVLHLSKGCACSGSEPFRNTPL